MIYLSEIFSANICLKRPIKHIIKAFHIYNFKVRNTYLKTIKTTTINNFLSCIISKETNAIKFSTNQLYIL